MDPLHLCLSSAHQPSFLYACKLVEEHLVTLYDEYKKFCLMNGKSFDPNLTIKKVECSNIKTLLETTKPTNKNLNPSTSNSNLPIYENRSQSNLEEEFSKLKMDNLFPDNDNNIMNSISNNNSNNNNNNNNTSITNNNNNNNFYPKEFPSFNLNTKKPEPFYPSMNKSPPLTSFAESNFYPNQQMNKNLVMQPNNTKIPQKGIQNNMMPNNNFGNFNQMQQNFMNFGQNMSGQNMQLNNLYQNPSHISSYLKEINLTEEEIKKMIEDRNKARREQNFLEADRIRNFLKSKGIALMDEKGGRGKGTEVTTWKIFKFNNFNNQKNNDFYSFNNNNPYYNEEGNSNNNTGFNGKFFKYNP